MRSNVRDDGSVTALGTARAAPVVYTERRLVTMGDTDASGLIFYPAVSRWAAAVFDAWLHAVERPLREVLDGGTAMPIVHVEADIRAPLGLSDVIEVALSVPGIGEHSLQLRMECRRQDGVLAVVVQTTHVWVRVRRAQGFGPPVIEKTPVPEWFRALAGQAATPAG